MSGKLHAKIAHLFAKMRRLSGELDAIGNARDEATKDDMAGYRLQDIPKLVRQWDNKLEQIFAVEEQLKQALKEASILRPTRRTASKTKKTR